MTDDFDKPLSIPRWLQARWKPLVALLLTAGVLVGITALLTSNHRSGDWDARALWPDRLSADVPTLVPVSGYHVERRSLEGGEVTIYRGLSKNLHTLVADVDSYERLATAQLDEHGFALLEIPPVQPLEGEGIRSLVVRAEWDGSVRWLRRDIERADSPTMALTLDRPLYQPGQKISMRSLIASATSGRPVDAEVTFRVHDARSNLVFEEQISTGANGVAHAEFALADRCVQGEYRVEVEHAGIVTEKLVEVRPFRLPRFEVEVLPETTPVEPGNALTGRVQAIYTYGEPVVDATVTLVARAGTLGLEGVSGKTDDDGVLPFEISVPRNANKGQQISLDATVTSAAGRAESGSGTAAVAGRAVSVEIVPARNPAFSWGVSQRGYVVVTTPGGTPVKGARVDLVLPQEANEKEVSLTTDAKGRAAFDWTPDYRSGSYVSATVFIADAVVFKQNIHPEAGHRSQQLSIDRSVVEAGETLKVEVGETKSYRDVTAMVAIVRDGVTLGATVVDDQRTAVDLKVPPEAAGQADVVVFRHGSIVESVPVWVRQRGGDSVDVTLQDAEVRPGSQTKVSLAFSPGDPEDRAAGDAPPVTFGLVGVDEALYALKERADVPLHILMRRAPAMIDAALSAFDGVDPQDDAGIDIATSRFRSSFQHHLSMTNGSDMTTQFVRHSRRPWLYTFMFLFLALGLAVCGRMVQWTWSITERSAFGWRRVASQVGFAVFCGIFAVILLATEAAAFTGGLSVWAAIMVCWLVAAAARLPELPLARWLWAHLLAVAFLTASMVLGAELSRGPVDVVDWLVVIAVGVPLALTAIQWFVWSLVLVRDGELQAGRGLFSLFGIVAIGMLGVTMNIGRTHDRSVRFARSAAPMQEMAEPMRADVAGDGAGPEPAAPPPGDPTSAAAPTDSGPRVRSWFPETMVWLPQIASDAQGRASVDVEVPDSITTWRLDAWANTQDGRFGQGQAKLLAVQPYFVELDLPTEVISGDRFQIPVTLVNRSGDPLTVDLNISVDGALASRGGNVSSRRLAPKERSIVWLNLYAADVGEGSVTVSSNTAEGVTGDAVQRTLNVQPDGRLLRESRSGIVGEGWETTVRTPPDTIRNTRVAEVRLYSSLVADALSGLDGMLRQPNGCFEQTSSANYPNVMVLRALRDTKRDDWPGGPEKWDEAYERADDLVRLGYQKILTFQRPGGGFAIYPDAHESEVMLTAYGVMQLAWAKDVTTVDERVIRRAADWLVAQQSSDGSWSGSRRGMRSQDDIGRVRATAFVVMALSATQDPKYRTAIERALDRMGQRIESVESANALAFAANAFVDAGAKEAAKKTVDRLASMVTREAKVAFWRDRHPTWMGGWSTYADRETTALALQALLATETQAELIQPVLNYIAQNRGQWGGWGTTQATIWTLRALETLRSRSSEQATLRFYWDSQQLPTVQGEQTLQVEKGPQPMQQFSFEPQQADGRFVVDSTAETTATVQLVNEYAVDWDSRYAQLDEEPFGGELELEQRQLRRGQRVRAYARIENLLQNDLSMVIVEVPVSPGAFVADDSLDDLVQGGAIDTYEILPTHVRLYVSGIEMKGERVFAYDFVPLVTGTFSLPPLRAYPFYSPEPTTEVDAGDVQVK